MFGRRISLSPALVQVVLSIKTSNIHQVFSVLHSKWISKTILGKRSWIWENLGILTKELLELILHSDVGRHAAGYICVCCLYRNVWVCVSTQNRVRCQVFFAFHIISLRQNLSGNQKEAIWLSSLVSELLGSICLCPLGGGVTDKRSHCPRLHLLAMINIMAKSHLGKKGFVSLKHLRSQSIPEGRKGWKSTPEECCLLVCSLWILTTCQLEAPPTMGWALSHQSLFETLPQRLAYRPNWWWHGLK